MMRVKKWDIMMHRLLTEQRDTRVIAEKRSADKKELDKDDEDPKVGSKKSSKKKGGKIPPQLKMYIKKKKNKIDEAIAYLEKILIGNLDEEQADTTLQEYGKEKIPDWFTSRRKIPFVIV